MAWNRCASSSLTNLALMNAMLGASKACSVARIITTELCDGVVDSVVIFWMCLVRRVVVELIVIVWAIRR